MCADPERIVYLKEMPQTETRAINARGRLGRFLSHGNYYWVVESPILFLIIGLAFALVGQVLDQILSPRLRAL